MEKKTYKAIKDIETRVSTGETTTFAERNWMRIQLKREEKRRRERDRKLQMH